MISRSDLLEQLEANADAYFDDDPDQFTVRAIGLVLHFVDDEEIAYYVGKVLAQACGLNTYVNSKWGTPDVPEGAAADGLRRAAYEHSQRWEYDDSE
jgi:hypothetical protein